MPKGYVFRPTPEWDARLAELYRDGASYMEMSDALGIPWGSLHAHLRRLADRAQIRLSPLGERIRRTMKRRRREGKIARQATWPVCGRDGRFTVARVGERRTALIRKVKG